MQEHKRLKVALKKSHDELAVVESQDLEARAEITNLRNRLHEATKELKFAKNDLFDKRLILNDKTGEIKSLEGRLQKLQRSTDSKIKSYSEMCESQEAQITHLQKKESEYNDKVRTLKIIFNYMTSNI